MEASNYSKIVTWPAVLRNLDWTCFRGAASGNITLQGIIASGFAVNNLKAVKCNYDAITQSVNQSINQGEYRPLSLLNKIGGVTSRKLFPDFVYQCIYIVALLT